MIAFVNDFLDLSPKAQKAKVKVDKLVFNKIENLSKDTIRRVKEYRIEW